MMKVKYLSAMLLAAMMAMTSCSEADDLLDDIAELTHAEKNAAAQPLSGVWYACYKATGTAVSDAGDGRTAHYVRAFDVYEFHEDGTGSFHRHFIGEKATAPEISWGNGGNGDFTYTKTAYGKVTITLTREHSQPYARKWYVGYYDGDLLATGVNQAPIHLSPASDGLTEVFEAWNAEQPSVTRYGAGGGASINKPGIDFIDTYGLLIRFTGYILGKYGEAYVTGMIAGDHRDLVQVPAFANCGTISPNLMTYHIIGIDNWAFKGHDHIKTLTVSPDCLYIGTEAFRDCTGLVSAQLNPATLGDRAFMGCTSLETVSIAPASTLNKIGDDTFNGCTSLETVSIAPASTLNKIGDDTFNGCTSLSSIQFPQTVTSIGDRAFKGCGHLTTATLGMHLTTIGREAFSGCTTLSSVCFPLQLQSIGDEAFRYCVSLASVTIPIGIRKIGKKAFADCSSLSSVSPYQFEYHTEMADDAFEHTPMLHKPTVRN